MSTAYDKVEALLKPVAAEKPLQASLEDLTTFTFLIPLGAIYTNDRTAYLDLDKVATNTGALAVPRSPFTQLLVLIAFVLCVLRIVAHRFYNSHPWFDLIFSLAVWGIFLTVWILANDTLNKVAALQPVASSGSSLSTIQAETKKIVDLAAGCITRERDWAVLGFVLSSLYTAYCAFTIKDDIEGLMTKDQATAAAATQA